MNMTKAIENSYYNRDEDEIRLNKDELIFFKEALEEKKKKIQTSLDNSTQASSSQNQPKDEGDHASLEIINNVNSMIFKEQSKTLNQINRSLNKIAIGSYGICTLCEEAINIERLKVKIFTEHCITCQEIIENQQ